MKVEIPLPQGLGLRIADTPSSGTEYPTAALQKGLTLMDKGLDLAEEAVGFGVPVLQSGLKTIFPGRVALSCPQPGDFWEVTADFTLSLVERISNKNERNLRGNLLYWIKDSLADLIRRVPAVRSPLTSLSSRLRKTFDLRTRYVQTEDQSKARLIYRILPDKGSIIMDLETKNLPVSISQVMVMNELGAHHFEIYRDGTHATLIGQEIGCWQEVKSDSAWFESRTEKVSFGLKQVPGARLFYGRELAGNRLAWAGFGYSFPPSVGSFHAEVKVRRIQ